MKLPLVSRERYEEKAGECEALVLTLRQATTNLREQSASIYHETAERHAAEVTRLHELYGRMLDQQSTVQKVAIEQLMHLVQFGMPTKTEAVVSDREPDAETRLARRVTQETLDKAVANLRREYEKIGVPVTDEELRTEAQTIMTGGQWKPPASLAGFERD